MMMMIGDFCYPEPMKKPASISSTSVLICNNDNDDDNNSNNNDDDDDDDVDDDDDDFCYSPKWRRIIVLVYIYHTS